MTGNEQDAEEVVQEAFLRAYRSLDRFESRANFSTWLYRIGVNSALDLMRTRQRHTQGRAEVDPSAEGPHSLQSLPDERQASPERAAYGMELQKKLEHALARLTPGPWACAPAPPRTPCSAPCRNSVKRWSRR
jgi:RNA polymerase sigma-70 factor (ECF subfamily)